MTDRPARVVVEDLRVVQTGRDVDVVADISFSLRAGQTLGLVGESGSGKTTVALALLGYARRGLRIDAGRVCIDGEDILSISDEQTRRMRGARIAYVPQDPATALHPALKISTQLSETVRRHGSESIAPQARIEQVLGEVALHGAAVLGSYPHQLSGGQQQRVALAMAFIMRPSVIVLDEPTTGLDVTTQRHVLDTVRSLCAVHEVAAVFVSHDLGVVADLVDEVGVMYAGRMVEAGPKAAVFGAPGHPYTRALLRAVPSASHAHPLEGLRGQPPTPQDRPSGCVFVNRCEFAEEACRAEPPAPVALARSGHIVRCRRLDALPAYRPPQRRAPGAVGGAKRDRPLLAVGQLSASYGSNPVLHDVSWSVDGGECLAIVGESGSGKTTLARCVAGLHQRWTGRVSLRGAELGAAARERPIDALRAIQYIFQNPYGSLNPRKRIDQILELPLTQFSREGGRERRRRVAEALDAAALSADFRRRTPGELSGGERQRVAIARALVVEPDLIVCDEITSALDVSVQATIIETLRRLQEERGLALVFITHNLALVRSIAQRTAVMLDGRIVEQGRTADVLDAPTQPYTQRLLSDIPDAYDPETSPLAGASSGSSGSGGSGGPDASSP